MSFDYDIFISYAHVDDVSPFGQEKGWVDLLHERVSRLLTQALGYEPKIWRDGHHLQGNDVLDGALSEGVTRSLLLLPVITPRYVQSVWCNREMEMFHAAEPPPRAGSPAFRSRVFKVVKTPIPEHLLGCEPVHIRKLVGYRFYGKDDLSGEDVEFIPDPSDKQYYQMLISLVADLKRTLIELKHTPAVAVSAPQAAPSVSVPQATPPPVAAAAVPPVAAAPAATPTKYVYLAETVSDLTKERDAVRAELQQRGYGVLPEEELPLEERRLTEEAVRAALARCALSVHLVGAKFGTPPEDDRSASVVQIQEALAAERGAADASFQRLLWVPPTLSAADIKDADQRKFVERLQTGVTAGSEFLQTTVEDLKTRVVEKLTAAEKAKAEPAGRARRAKIKQVYLICDNSDSDLVGPITDYLFDENFEVITWREGEGGNERRMEYHRRFLCECDAALIYFGNGDELWVHKNLDDLLDKAYGYGREEDWQASAVFVGAPAKKEKERFRTHKVPIIRNLHGFNPEDLRQFVNAVRAAEGGRQ